MEVRSGGAKECRCEGVRCEGGGGRLKVGGRGGSEL